MKSFPEILQRTRVEKQSFLRLHKGVYEYYFTCPPLFASPVL